MGLVSLVSDLWEDVKAKVAIAVSTKLLDADRKIGQYLSVKGDDVK